MSAITARPVIRGVQTILATGGSIVSAATALQSTIRSMSSAAQVVYDLTTRSLAPNPTSLQPAVGLKQPAISLQQQVTILARQNGLPDDETNLLAALVTANLFNTGEPQILQQQMQVLQSNPTAASYQAFDRQLFASHQSVFTQQLVLATQAAALKVGFKDVRVTNAPDGTVRAFASDDTGRTLITEIGTSTDRSPTLATELIGTSDESCHQILDAFDRALEEAGVIADAPERKFTGGICELTAAKEFVRQQPVKPKSTATSKAKPVTSQQPPIVPKQQQQRF